MTRNLIFALGLVLGSVACSRTPNATTAKPAMQTPARSADNMNAGAGYSGGDPANVSRPSTEPTGIGGGPAGIDHSGMEHPESGSPEDPWMKGSSTDTGTTGTEPPESTKPSKPGKPKKADPKDDPIK